MAFQGNHICDAQGIGVFCTTHSRGNYANNQIFAHGLLNVKVTLQADPLFTKNANQGAMAVRPNPWWNGSGIAAAGSLSP